MIKNNNPFIKNGPIRIGMVVFKNGVGYTHILKCLVTRMIWGGIANLGSNRCNLYLDLPSAY